MVSAVIDSQNSEPVREARDTLLKQPDHNGSDRGGYVAIEAKI